MFAANASDSGQENLPHKPVTGDGEFHVAAPSFSVQPHEYCKPHTVEAIGMLYVGDRTITTAQSILHSAFPETKQWSFQEDDGSSRPIDHKIWKRMLWTRNGSPVESGPNRSTALVIITQPPWILSPKDMEQFVSRRRVSVRVGADDKRAQLRSSERVWAKVRRTH